MFKNIFTKKNIALFFVLFVFISLSMIIKSVYDNGDLNHTVIIRENNFSSNEKIDLFKGIYIKDEFKSKHNNLGIVSVKFNTHDRINNDFLEFKIKEKDSNEWFYSASYKVDQFQNNKYFPFGFPEINNSENKIYEFQIKSLGGVDNDFVSVNTGNSNFLTKYSFSKNYLLLNKDQIIKFICVKIISILIHVNLFSYVFCFCFSLIFILLNNKLNIIIHITTYLKNIFKKYTLIFKQKYIFKDHIFEYIFLTISFLIFTFLLLEPQKLTYDAASYYNLSSFVNSREFDILNINFSFRTYGFPLFVGFLIFISNIVNCNSLYFIFFINYLLFIGSIFLIFKILKKLNIKIANIFLIINSINIINLSFVNTVLTESVMIFIVSVIFFLLNSNKSKFNIFLLGSFLAYSVMIRPSNLVLFIICTIYVFYIYKNNIKLWFIYLIPIIFIFTISFLNVYNIEGKVSLFTKSTNGIYDMQIMSGVRSFKYETSVQENVKTPSIWYINSNVSEFTNITCKGSFNCLTKYLLENPFKYLVIIIIHFFTLFDRNYINTYVSNINNIDYILIVYNYLILSSAIVYFVFFNKQFLIYKKIFFSIFILCFSLLSIYLPTVIESRFSSPIFPLVTIFSSLYFYEIFKIGKNKNVLNILFLQFLIIILFSVISYLIFQTAQQ